MSSVLQSLIFFSPQAATSAYSTESANIKSPHLRAIVFTKINTIYIAQKKKNMKFPVCKVRVHKWR